MSKEIIAKMMNSKKARSKKSKSVEISKAVSVYTEWAAAV